MHLFHCFVLMLAYKRRLSRKGTLPTGLTYNIVNTYTPKYLHLRNQYTTHNVNAIKGSILQRTCIGNQPLHGVRFNMVLVLRT